MIRVLVDACLLVKGNVSNVLFDLAQNDIISLHWTPEIGAQFVKNWVIRRIHDENAERNFQQQPLLTDQETIEAGKAYEIKAKHRLKMFGVMAPMWVVPGWNPAVVGAAHTMASLGVGSRGGAGVHIGDYEVALAAIKLAEQFPNDEVWLATENIAHLPPVVLKKFGVWSLHQGTLLETLYASNPDGVRESLLKTIAETFDPVLERKHMIKILADPQQFGSPSVGDAVSKSWKIAATAVPAKAQATTTAVQKSKPALTAVADIAATPQTRKKPRRTKGPEQGPATFQMFS
jgi:hypothetical protein